DGSEAMLGGTAAALLPPRARWAATRVTDRLAAALVSQRKRRRDSGMGMSSDSKCQISRWPDSESPPRRPRNRRRESVPAEAAAATAPRRDPPTDPPADPPAECSGSARRPAWPP